MFRGGGLIILEGRIDNFGGDHNSNCFVHNGIESYMLA